MRPSGHLESTLAPLAPEVAVRAGQPQPDTAPDRLYCPGDSVVREATASISQSVPVTVEAGHASPGHCLPARRTRCDTHTRSPVKASTVKLRVGLTSHLNKLCSYEVSSGTRSQIRRRRNCRTAFPLVVGLGGFEPGTSSLSGFCPRP